MDSDTNTTLVQSFGDEEAVNPLAQALLAAGIQVVSAGDAEVIVPVPETTTKKPRRAKKARPVIVKAEPVETGDAHDEVPAEPTTVLVEQQPALAEESLTHATSDSTAAPAMEESVGSKEHAASVVESAPVVSRRGVTGHLNGRLGEVFVIGDGPSVGWPEEDVLVIGPVGPQLGDIVELTDNPNGRTMATVLAPSPYVLATITNVGSKYGFARLVKPIDGLSVVFLTLTQAASLMEQGLKVGDRVAIQLLPPDNSDLRYQTRLRVASVRVPVERTVRVVIGRDARRYGLPGDPLVDNLPDFFFEDGRVLIVSESGYGYLRLDQLTAGVWDYRALVVPHAGTHGIERIEVLSVEPIVLVESAPVEELVEPIPAVITVPSDSGNGHHEDVVMPTEVLAGAAVPA